jgi:hypothetical protein
MNRQKKTSKNKEISSINNDKKKKRTKTRLTSTEPYCCGFIKFTGTDGR